MIKKYSYTNIAAVLLTALLVVMPFHAAIVTIAGNFLPYKSVLQAWKEILVLVIGIICAYAFYKDRELFQFNFINKLALAIILFSILVSLINYSEFNALLAGIKTNLVVLVLFLEAQILASKYSFEKIFKIVIIPAAIVAIIAILQPSLLKPEILKTIGYSTDSINAIQFVESSDLSIRVFSTLGGPNQLGAYLIIPFALSLAWAIKSRKIAWYLLPIVFVWPIYMSYSRSAWLGTIVAAIAVVALNFRPKTQLIVGASVVALLAMFGFMFYTGGVCRYLSEPVEVLVHGDCRAGNLGGSDMMRVSSIENGINTIIRKPFGSGLGTAGPASFYTNNSLIVENWYLQLAIEIGLVGLLMYIAFIVLCLNKLYIKSKEKGYSVLPAAIFASICGVLVTSLFLHTLADSTLSIVLFGLLGLTINSRFKEQKL